MPRWQNHSTRDMRPSRLPLSQVARERRKPQAQGSKAAGLKGHRRCSDNKLRPQGHQCSRCTAAGGRGKRSPRWRGRKRVWQDPQGRRPLQTPTDDGPSTSSPRSSNRALQRGHSDKARLASLPAAADHQEEAGPGVVPGIREGVQVGRRVFPRAWGGSSWPPALTQSPSCRSTSPAAGGTQSPGSRSVRSGRGPGRRTDREEAEAESGTRLCPPRAGPTVQALWEPDQVPLPTRLGAWHPLA